MDRELKFSLSYEQLLQETEERIKQYVSNKTGLLDLDERNKARDLLSFWHKLALLGNRYAATPDPEMYERIDADWEHLDALIKNEGIDV